MENDDSVTEFSSEFIAEAIHQGLTGLDDEAAHAIGAGLGAIMSDSPVTGAALGGLTGFLLKSGAAGFLAKNFATNKTEKIDTKLRDFAEEMQDADKRHQRIGAVVASQLTSFLPNGDKYAKAALQAGEGQYQELAGLLEDYQRDPELQAELEASVTRLLGKDGELQVSELQTLFGVDSTEKSLSLFFEFSKSLTAKKSIEAVDEVTEVQLAVNAISDELKVIHETVEEEFQQRLQSDLRDAGFVRLTPVYYRQYPPIPKQCYNRPFRLSEVSEGYAIERQLPETAPTETLSERLLMELKTGAPQLLTGPSGSGKSTVCKQVATKWHDRGHGAVLYREAQKTEFSQRGKLEAQISNLKSEGRVLVVVEDVLREEQSDVLNSIERYQQDEEVAFLCDARDADIETATKRMTAQQTSHSRRVRHLIPQFSHYPLPDPSLDDCRALIDCYQRATGDDVIYTADELCTRVEEQKDTKGGLLLLTYLLIHGSEDSHDPLTEHARATALRFECSNFATSNPIERDLRDVVADAALAVNVLNVSSLKFSPEFLFTLGYDRRRTERALSILEDEILFRAEESYSLRHELWSRIYLETVIDERGLSVMPRVCQLIEGILDLRDETYLKTLRTSFPDSKFLDSVDATPDSSVGVFITVLYKVGVDYPSLVQLFDSPRQPLVPIGDLPNDIEGTIRLTRASAAIGAGSLTDAVADLEAIISDTDFSIEQRSKAHLHKGDLATQSGEFDEAMDAYLTARSLLDSVNEPWLEISVLDSSGFVHQEIGETEKAIELHQRAFELAVENELEGFAFATANQVALACLEAGHIDTADEWLDIAESQLDENAIGGSVDSTLAGNQALLHIEKEAYTDAIRAAERAMKLYQERGDQIGVARSKQNIANALHSQYKNGDGELNGDLKRAEQLLSQAFDTFQDAEYYRDLQTVLHTLGSIYESQDEFENIKPYIKRIEQIPEGDEYIDLDEVQRALSPPDNHLPAREPFLSGLVCVRAAFESGEVQDSKTTTLEQALKKFVKAIEHAETHEPRCTQYDIGHRARVFKTAIVILIDGETEASLQDLDLVEQSRLYSIEEILYDTITQHLEPNQYSTLLEKSSGIHPNSSSEIAAVAARYLCTALIYGASVVDPIRSLPRQEDGYGNLVEIEGIQSGGADVTDSGVETTEDDCHE
ncbi:P-loop NTPase [Haloferax volcanii]|uniref:P-loop NTPase n=1 Tax=Haloferax volcanii TaxID=2246 RepID=UPI00249ABF7A|nr:hypothetical protein [Haloferax alexandrinus]WEL28709.1 TPR repeat-containing protein [Haloferax alexandrinus]